MVEETVSVRILLIIVVAYLMKSSLEDKKVKKIKKKTLAGNFMGTMKDIKNKALRMDSSDKHHHDMATLKKSKTKASKNKIDFKSMKTYMSP